MAGNQAKFQKAISQGHSAAWDMEWEKAVEFYSQALEEFPEDVQTLNNLANAYYELQKYAEALQMFGKVIRHSPNDPIPLEKVAKVLEYQQQYEQSAEVSARAAEFYLQGRDAAKAIENLSHSVQLSPENIQRRSRLALIYERLGRKDQAVREYLVIASLLQAQGQKERAIQLIERCAQLAPNSKEVHQALGLLRANQQLPRPRRKVSTKMPVPVSPAAASAQLGLDAGSSTSLQEAGTLQPQADHGDPVSVARRESLAEMATMLFDQDEPLQEAHTIREGGIQHLLQKGTGPLSQVSYEKAQIMLHLSQAVDLQSRKKNEEAAAEIEKAIDAGLDSAAAYIALGLIRLETGRFESAMRNLQHAVQHPKYVLAGRLLLGKTLYKMNRVHDAALQYLEALKWADSMSVDEDDANDLFQLYDPIIETYFQRGEQAVENQRLCAAVEDLLLQANWRERVAQARKQLPKAPAGSPPMPLAELITQVESTHVLVALTNIHDLARRGLYRIAMEEAFWALHFAPNYLPLHSFMAEILMEQEQLQDAINKYSVVARAYSARGDSGRAIEIFRRITRLAPLDLSIRRRLIEVLTAAGKMEETIQEYIELGDVYYRLAELDKARETYQRALSVTQQASMDSKWTIEVLHHLADIDLQMLDWRRGLRLFQQIRGLDPMNEKANMNLIELNLRMGNETAAMSELGNYVAYLNGDQKRQIALEFLENLALNNAESIPIRKTLADQYQIMGMLSEAIEQLEFIGDTLLEAGDRQGAIQAIEQIIRMKPANIAEYRQILANLRER